MNLRSVDLNLLVVFDRLMETRHVSRAAQHLGLGQPGVSAALGRLRHLFDDPLLVRQGHEMVPTDRALKLQPDVRRVLQEVAKVVAPPEDFRPDASGRTFRLRLSDLLSALFLPTLVPHLAERAPGVGFDVEHLSPEATVDALERGGCELAVSTGLDKSKSIAERRLFGDTVVCLARKELKIGRAPVAATLERAESFASLPQVRVSQSPLDDRFADRALAANGLRRNVMLTVPHWLAVPEIIAGSSLVALVPKSFAATLPDHLALDAHPLPFMDTRFNWSLYWHRRATSDRGLEWLRETFLGLFGAETGLRPPLT